MLWHYSRCIEYIGFLWICITVPFQIILLLSILRRFNYFKINKSFYLFYVINTFMDLINLFCVCFGMLFPAWGFFIMAYVNIGANLGKWLLIASFWSRMSQGIACLIIAVNRCSAILYPLNYEKIWNKTLISIAVFVQIFAGAPFAAIAGNKEYLWYVNISTAVEYNIKLDDLVIEQNQLYWDQIQTLKVIWRNSSDRILIFLVGFVVETSCCVLLIVTYCIMGGVLWYRNKKARNAINSFYTPNTTQRTKINQQLFKMAAWVCTIEILFTLFLAIIVTIPIHPNLFYALYNTVSILYSTLNPYILIFCSQYTRNLFLETLFEIKNIFSRVSNAASSSVAAAAAAMPSQNQIKLNLRGNETRAPKNKSGTVEHNFEEWFNVLLEVNDVSFVMHNVECRLGKSLFNIKLWKLYISFLEEHGEYGRLMGISDLYCRFFMDDKEMKEKHKEGMTKY